MKKLTIGLVFAVMLGVVGAVPALLTSSGQVSAQEQEQASATEDDEQGVVYRYTAQPGDSYTLLARKAVQTYGLKHDVQLSQAQIIYAETRLTQAAGSPVLNLGQQVEIAESQIKQWVEQAQELTDKQQAAWAHYAQFANFNTDHVGEAR